MKTIDVLYPVRDMRIVDCKDLNTSMEFLKKNNFDINFCIFDVGHNSSEEKLRNNIEYDFKYGYERWAKHYGLSKAINLGVKELVESDIFIISEFTSIVPGNIIETMLQRFEKDKFTIFGRMKFLIKELNLSLPFEELAKEENYLKDPYSKRAMFKLTSKEIFYNIGGYEEAYLDDIADIEEKDFVLRSAIVKGSAKVIINNAIYLLKIYNNKQHKESKTKQDLFENKIKKYRELSFLDPNYNVPIINKKRERRKTPLTEDQIKHLYSIETSL
ncbi:MAG: hypothetical protein ACW98D_18050 [Promethearchaeota archaeon]|jgi:hypothetical protein